MGRTAEQRQVRAEAKADLSASMSGRAGIGLAGVLGVFLAMIFWLHPGNFGDSVFFAVTLGPLITGAALPRRSDSYEVRQLKRTASTVLAVSAVVMLFTLSAVSALIIGAALGLILAGYYQLFSSINDSGRYARRRLDEMDR